MNRCLHYFLHAPRRRLVGGAMGLWLGLGLAAHVAAQVREFPKAALRGELQIVAPPQILMDGRPDRLSPGARIRGTTNGLVLSGNLVGQRLVVNYLRESNGLVHEVWLLTEQEAALKRPGMEPARNFVFESDVRVPHDDGKTPFNQLPKYKQ